MLRLALYIEVSDPYFPEAYSKEQNLCKACDSP